jgi:hypothetical protein
MASFFPPKEQLSICGEDSQIDLGERQDDHGKIHL